MTSWKKTGVRWKSVGLGLAIDVIGSVGVGLILGIVLGVATGFRRDADLSPEHLATVASNVGVKAIGLVGTLFFTGVGGFVAARMSAPHGMLNALMVGWLSLLMGIALAISIPGLTPFWKLALGSIGTVPAALLGGSLAIRKTGPV